MSQTVNIAASFEFRPRPVRWELAEATVAGWAKRDDGNDDTDHLACSATTAAGELHTVKVTLQTLDFEQWNWIAGSPHYIESEEVAEMCEGFVLRGLLAIPDDSREPRLGDAWAM